mmetsp:Transcript_20054/g.27541  ORF Transcript_20054/g.27541 Transcript_20054/m.27541 type:complete len:89 (-) Transcript_20054:133-399(-)
MCTSAASPAWSSRAPATPCGTRRRGPSCERGGAGWAGGGAARAAAPGVVTTQQGRGCWLAGVVFLEQRLNETVYGADLDRAKFAVYSS